MSAVDQAIHYLEIITPEPEATSAFYSEAFGWQFEQVPELGNAFAASIPGGALCGIRAPMHDQEAPITRTYLRVPDIEAAVSQAEKLGANIALPPMEIPGRGRIAIYFLGDIQQGVWEP